VTAVRNGLSWDFEIASYSFREQISPYGIEEKKYFQQFMDRVVKSINS
jgi:hypothetical protein